MNLFRAAGMLTLITPAELATSSPMALADGRIVRYARHADQFHPERVQELVKQPLALLASHYFPNQLAAAQDAHEAGRRLFPILALLAQALGLPSFNELVPATPQLEQTAPAEVNQADHFGDAARVHDFLLTVADVIQVRRGHLGWKAELCPGLTVSRTDDGGVHGQAERFATGPLDLVDDVTGEVHAHRRVRALDAGPEVKARVARRLIALTDASKHDLAKGLDVPQGTVMSRLSRARLALAEKLKDKPLRAEKG